LRESARWAAILALLLCACRRDTELGSGHIAVRDASGAVTGELRATTYGYLIKPERVRVSKSGDALDAGKLRYAAGKLWQGSALRASVERKGAGVALYDFARAPLGQLVDRDGETWVYDPGGVPLGRARRDGDRVVLVDRNGAARGYVTGLPPQGAAALLLGGGLSSVEKDVLALAIAAH
jgi:hypothetical protein